MNLNRLAIGLALMLALAPPVNAESQTARTPRGATLQVQADFPTGPGPFPAVVLASGTGYHMALPVLEQSARRLNAAGVAVYRFNWAYFSEQGKSGRPSDDLGQEMEDFASVLALARADARVDKSRISVGGKSMGSVVAWRAFRADSTLRSGLFLTPICSRQAKDEATPRAVADANYPGMAEETRPMSFIAGDRDPLCAPAFLYRFAASNAGGKARVAVVGGDHSFAPQAAADEPALARNVAAATRAAADFIAEFSID
jgi:predicted alpha/beta-hydrolase family hydrolase